MPWRHTQPYLHNTLLVPSCVLNHDSFSRTALNHQSGARSALSNLFVGLVVLVALLAFTPYLFYLPMACLGGIIEVRAHTTHG